MLSRTALVILASSTLAFSGAAYAESRIHERQKSQIDRIEAGAGSGELTGSEMERLGREQLRIDNFETKARADGDLTARERLKIEAGQDAASADIHRLKHNDKSRP